MADFGRRLVQVWHYLFSRQTPEDLRRAALILAPGEMALFQALSAPDQAHGARVAGRLERQGAPREVVAAGFLHDAGKPSGYGLVWRSLAVLFPGEAPPPDPPARGSWRRARQIYHWHGHYAARALQRAGAPPDLQALVRGEGAGIWADAFARADEEG